MSTEKRLVLFLVLSVATMWGMQMVLDQMGWLPKPPQRPPVAQQKAPDQDPDAVAAEKPGAAEEPAPGPELADGQPAPDLEADADAAPEAPVVPLLDPSELILGSTDPQSPYHLEVHLDQKGAGVGALLSSRFEAERIGGKPTDRPLVLIQPDPLAPPSFSLELSQLLPRQARGAEPAPADAAVKTVGAGGEEERLALDRWLWEVVRDDQGRAVRPVTRDVAKGKPPIQGQEVVFRTTAGKIIVTKTYRLWEGQDSFDLLLEFSGDTPRQALAYELLGPHGVPIEGEWYTGTFRDVFFGMVAEGEIEIDTVGANEVAKYAQPGREQERYTRPLAYAGVENQYFAVFLEPVPRPDSPEASRIEEARPALIRDPGREWQKADVSVELQSKPFELAAGESVAHQYRIFAGPKTVDALAPYGALDLADYRKGWHLWVVGDLGASFMSKYFIRPLLGRIYLVTEYITGLFGSERGNWGVAIILLTVVVRLILFPLGRKQARAAKKMQDLQPKLLELKTKYGDDKERITKETFAMYRENGVNPLGGCLPALVQLPVLIGLWQTLNNSVSLRHSEFLWIDNLAAPDMLFKFPFHIPLIGGWLGPYFNILPIVVVALMLVQTKLFAPPATTPEAEQQQKMMKYMMVFMAFLFYKVPSGLGIYFITSSLWQIGERMLVSGGPTPGQLAAAETSAADDRRGRSEGNASALPSTTASGPGAAKRKGGWLADLRERAQQIVDEAEKQRTVRNTPPGGGNRDRDRDRRDRNQPRPKPGRKR